MENVIMLDAGHGGLDSGAVYKGRKEKDDNLRVTQAVGNQLENAGYRVLYVRTTDNYDTPFEKVQIANDSGADYFISFHRNSGETPDTYQGVQSLIYANDTRAEQVADAIQSELVTIGFKDLGVVERPGLVVLRRSKMPAILMELGFINNEKDNQLFDEKFEQMVTAIVTGIKEAIPLQQGEKRYGVQVGLFRYPANANFLKEELEAEGYSVIIREEPPYDVVIVGNENSLEEAVTLQNQLRKEGYETLVVNL